MIGVPIAMYTYVEAVLGTPLTLFFIPPVTISIVLLEYSALFKLGCSS